MSGSTHDGAKIPCSLSTTRWLGRIHPFVTIAILCFLPLLALSALGAPPAVPPESGGKPTPGAPPEKPLSSDVPPAAPSNIDPGIQHVPEKRGDSRGTVKPPDLDPGISKNPDAGSPGKQGHHSSRSRNTEKEARGSVKEALDEVQ